MAGMIFIVTIPTECAENKLKITPHNLQFDKTLNIPSSNENHLPTFDQKYADVEACTSNANRIPSDEHLRQKKSISLDTVSINISSSPTQRMGVASNGYHHLEDNETTKNRTTSAIGELNSIKKSWEGFKDIVSSATKLNPLDRKRPDDDAEFSSNNRLLDIASDSSMETILNELLKKFCVENSVWQMSRDGAFHQITFSVEADYRHKFVLNTLSEWGIGERKGSCVSVIPCAVYNSSSRNHDEKNEKDFCEEWIISQKQTAWERFMCSIRARLNVAQIVQSVKEDAALTFDFVTLIIVASTLAAFGLVENSTILLVSSMLISPLMGPIIAIIFGIVIDDRCLIRLGWAHEIFGIFLATTVGFFFGLIVYSLDAYGNGLVTGEMLSRCELHSLIVGILTALPSGAAAAIAILGENIGSLVGVAISASILPPAVNAGIFWSMAFLHSFNAAENQTVSISNYYSDHQSTELAIYGALSMLLTATNIVCILLMGVIVLKIKEVVPITTKHQRQFWKHDIKVARNYNHTNHANEDDFTQKLADEINEMQQSIAIDTDIVGAEFLCNINRKSYQNTWSPTTNRHSIFNGGRERRPSLADLEKICAHLSISPKQCDRSRAPVYYASGTNKPIAGQNCVAEHIVSNDAKVRRKSCIENQLEKISEISQSASNSAASEIHSAMMTNDDKLSTDSTNSKPRKPTRKFIVTPAFDPLL